MPRRSGRRMYGATTGTNESRPQPLTRKGRKIKGQKRQSKKDKP